MYVIQFCHAHARRKQLTELVPSDCQSSPSAWNQQAKTTHTYKAPQQCKAHHHCKEKIRTTHSTWKMSESRKQHMEDTRSNYRVKTPLSTIHKTHVLYTMSCFIVSGLGPTIIKPLSVINKVICAISALQTPPNCIAKKLYCKKKKTSFPVTPISS